MTPSEAMSATYLWLAIFGVSATVFFGIAIWVIFRGGKDVLEILRASGEPKK